MTAAAVLDAGQARPGAALSQINVSGFPAARVLDRLGAGDGSGRPGQDRAGGCQTCMPWCCPRSACAWRWRSGRSLPGPGQIHLRVEACGVCRTDLHVVDGNLPRPRLPLIPGHEERQLLSVANLTRRDATEFLAIAYGRHPRTKTTDYPLAQANQALDDLRAGRFQRAAVLVPKSGATFLPAADQHQPGRGPYVPFCGPRQDGPHPGRNRQEARHVQPRFTPRIAPAHHPESGPLRGISRRQRAAWL